MKKTIIILLIVLGVIGCKKDNIKPPAHQNFEEWEKFIGNYKVYDSIGNFLYNMDIKHFYAGKNIYGNDADSLVLQNFADTFDLKIDYSYNSVNHNILSIGFNDSVVDYNNKMWYVASLVDDSTTSVRENTLINDTLIMYFELNNIKFYINQGVAYHYCACKHVAVKQ